MTVQSLQTSISNRIGSITNSALRTSVQEAFAAAGSNLQKLELLDGALARSARGSWNTSTGQLNPSIGPAVFYSGFAPPESGFERNFQAAQALRDSGAYAGAYLLEDTQAGCMAT